MVFHLYCRTPFGRMHKGNPDVIRLAELIRRTPSSVAMKLSNFASLDPAEQARGIAGLDGASTADRELFERALADWDAVLREAEEAQDRLGVAEPAVRLDEPTRIGPSETLRTVKVRRLQGFFREAVLAAYDFTCAMTGIRVPELLNASHIVPWARDERRRADPRNGIALSALHDRAFDRGLITIDQDHRVVVSRALRMPDASDLHHAALVSVHGSKLTLPSRFLPDPTALTWHREHVFRDRVGSSADA